MIYHPRMTQLRHHFIFSGKPRLRSVALAALGLAWVLGCSQLVYAQTVQLQQKIEPEQKQKAKQKKKQKQTPEAAPVSKPVVKVATPVGEASAVVNSELDGELFFKILLGELSLQNDNVGDAYALLLNSAIQAKEPRLFERVVGLAAQARSGQLALKAAQAWRVALPDSAEAARAELQILIALNKTDLVTAALNDYLRLALSRIADNTGDKATEKALTHDAVFSSVVDILARLPNPKVVAGLAEKTFLTYTDKPATAMSAWVAIGRVRLAANDNSGALDAARQAQKGQPYALGPVLLALAMMGPKTPLAESVVKQYLALPSVAGQTVQPQAIVLYARTLQSQGRFDEGMKALAALPETTTKALQYKAAAQVQLLRDEKQHKTAYEVLTNAINKVNAMNASAAELADLQYDLAMSAEKLDKLREMERLLQSVIAAKPNDAQAYNALGYSLAERGVRLPEAKDLIQKAVSLAPTDPFIADSLGWVEFKLGNLPEAASILAAAFEAKPDAEIATHLGEVLWQQGKKNEAVAMWKTATKLNPTNETLLETLKRLRVRLDDAP